MLRWSFVILVWLAAGGAGHAQQPAPPGMGLATAAAHRFPQPVPVATLLNRRVLQPLESQPTLGFVRAIVQQPDGTIAVIVDFGGVFGHFSRPIAVPLDAMAVMGPYMEILDFTPKQLAAFKTFDPASATQLPVDTVLRVALAKPSH